MRPAWIAVLVACAWAAGCGKEIGDECAISSDCDPNGTRICDYPASPQGYCTIQGCDYNTCPEEAVCVRFFTGHFENKPCTDSSECGSFDELCSLEGHCVARSSEVRYCMRRCEGDDDCRDNYQCRDIDDMKANGGEPVLAPGLSLGSNPPRFCAVAPV